VSLWRDAHDFAPLCLALVIQMKILYILIIIIAYSNTANASYVARCLIEGKVQALEEADNKLFPLHNYNISISVGRIAKLSESYEGACASEKKGEHITAPLILAEDQNLPEKGNDFMFEYFFHDGLCGEERRYCKTEYFLLLDWN